MTGDDGYVIYLCIFAIWLPPGQNYVQHNRIDKKIKEK